MYSMYLIPTNYVMINFLFVAVMFLMLLTPLIFAEIEDVISRPQVYIEEKDTQHLKAPLNLCLCQ